MSEENLMPLLGSVMPSVPATFEPELPAVEVEVQVEEPKYEQKKSKKEPVLKSEGDKIIYISSLKVNALAGNSESVKVVQLRLNDLGFSSVMNDKFGRLEGGAVEAINEFRKSKGLDECGCFDEQVLAYLFDGENVGVRP